MGILGLKSKSKSAKALSSSPVSWVLQNGTWTMPQDNPQTYIDGFKSLPNLYGIISLITQKSSIVPFQVMTVKNRSAAQKYKAMMRSVNVKTNYKKIMKVKEQAFDVVDNSELEELLLKPNALQAMEELNEAHDGYLLLTGNSIFKGQAPGVGKNAKKPKELFVIPSPCVEPKADGLEIVRYKVSYYKEEIDAEEIGHTKYFNPINGSEAPVNQLMGMSPLLSCRNLLKRYEAADIAQGAMFQNMGPVGIINGEGGELTEPQAQQVKDKFNEKHVGHYKAGNFVVTPARLHWTQIGLSPVDLNTIEGKKEILNEMCNVYHVPIGIFTENNSTDNNMDNSRKMLITDAVIPLVEKRKQTINKWLAPKFGDDLFIEYDYSVFDEMQEDLGEKVEWLDKAWWLSPNQKLGETGFEESADPLMNQIYIPSSYLPLKDTSLEVEDIDEEEIDGINA